MNVYDTTSPGSGTKTVAAVTQNILKTNHAMASR